MERNIELSCGEKNKNIKWSQSKNHFDKNKLLLSYVDRVLNRKMRQKVTLK